MRRTLPRLLLALGCLVGLAVTVEAGLFHRRVAKPVFIPCPCPPADAEPQTVERLARRVKTLDDTVAGLAGKTVTAADLADLRTQIARIGLPGQRPPGVPPATTDVGLGTELPPDVVQTVGGEIGRVRRGLRKAQGEVED